MEILSPSLAGVSPSYSASDALTKGSQTSSMGMDDFLQLLVAQLTNQNVMDPMDNTEFISQMAQFTALQAMQDIGKISKTQYASSLIDKNVIVAKYDENGKYVQDEGIVERVNFSAKETTITVNGKSYDLSSIMEIVAKTSAPDIKPSADVASE